MYRNNKMINNTLSCRVKNLIFSAGEITLILKNRENDTCVEASHLKKTMPRLVE